MTSRVDPTVLRRSNLGVVLRHIATAGPISRARVAADTGLNKSTVSSIVAELDELGLVREGADHGRAPAVGRPATPIVITGTTVALGLEIAVDGLVAGVEDLTGAVRFETRRTRMLGEDPPLKVLDDLAALAREAFARAQTDELRVVGVGVAVPGLVDVGLRTLLRAPNLGWTQVAIGAELESRLGLPAGVVAVGNEANLAALAELWDGVALDLSSFIHVTGQVGVGAGIVIDGELYRGLARLRRRARAHDRAARWRPVRVRRPGLPGDRRRPRGDPPPRRHGAAGRRRRVRDGGAARAARGGPRRGRDHRHRRGRRGARDRALVRDQPARPRGARAGRVLHPALSVAGAAGAGCAVSTRVLASTWSQFDVRGSVLGVQAPVRGAAAIHLRAVLNRPWLVADSLGLVPGRPRPRGSAGAASVGS